MIFSKPGWMIYKEQMDLFHCGDALWEPAPNHNYERVRLGDVGYIRRGRFHLLFSAGCPLGSRQLGVDVPETFEPLDIGPITFGEPRLPGCLGTSTNEESEAEAGISTSRNAPVKPGTNFSFELTQKQEAALVTKCSTFREDTDLEAAFEDYTKRHYNSWATFARNKRCGNDIKPVLISGVDMTKDFAMMAYSNNGTSRSCKFIVSGPVAGSSSAPVWGTWKTQGVVHTNCGPRCSQRQGLEQEPPDIDARETPDDFKQCVFVRYYTMRFRALVFPKVIKAGAGPHDLGPGDNHDKRFPELLVPLSLDLDTEVDRGGDSAPGHLSSVASYDSELEIVRNVPSEEKDAFDVIAEYILKNSGAEAVLIHHRDIAWLREGASGMEIPDVLSERQPAVKVDSGGVGRLIHRGQQQLETPSPNPQDGTTEHVPGPDFGFHTSIRPPTWGASSLNPSSSNVETSGDPQDIHPPPPLAPQFPSTPPDFPQVRLLPHIPVPPAQSPALQSQSSRHPLSCTDQAQDVGPMHPPSVSARRSSSPPATGRIPSPDAPPRFPMNSPPTNVERAHIDEDEEALALAIALSEKELKDQVGKATQEEEDIAKAIEESLKHAPSFGIPVSSPNVGPSTYPQTTSSLSFPSPSPVSESPIPPQTPFTSSHTPRVSTSLPVSRVSSPSILPTKPVVGDDGALAQRFAKRVAAIGPPNLKPASLPLPTSNSETTTPPAPALATTPRKREAQQYEFPTRSADFEPPPPLYHDVVSASTSVLAKTFPNSLPYDTSPGKSAPASAVLDGKSPTPGSAGLSSSMPTDPGPWSPPELYEALPSSTSSTSARPITPNSFVDQRLLIGVSLGFGPPQISSIKTTLKGSVPNVISLPTGRCAPFHIQAPDWRHLLKMMARLSGSRIEASDEALVAYGQEPKLRTVVQFVKVNPASQDWRTVIYLTIDHPLPAIASKKLTNGDVNALPHSYTLGPLPLLLQDGPNSQMSKYYTIPATSTVPYPTLPISLPNMAGYLASAVDDSRRMLHDNSSGMKRLAKTLDALYPGEVELGMEDDEPQRPPGGVVNMFRNVFGRGRRDQRQSSDNYADLVTPFVPEWG